jgi:acylphosphatase
MIKPENEPYKNNEFQEDGYANSIFSVNLGSNSVQYRPFRSFLTGRHMEGKPHYNIRINGHVQGVGFRWSAARVANLLGIKGFVRNMPDGSVYIEAEGTEKKLEEFIHWCRKGPSFGHVETVIAEKGPAVDYREFTIDH